MGRDALYGIMVRMGDGPPATVPDAVSCPLACAFSSTTRPSKILKRIRTAGLAPAAPAPAEPTGIDYLRMVAGAHREQQASSINFTALAAR